MPYLVIWYQKCKTKTTTYGVGYPSAGSVQVQTYNLFLPYDIKNVKQKTTRYGFTFLIPYERYKLYDCTCTESALGYPMPYLVVFCFTFLIPYGRNKLYVCTCTESAL
jgi:hypothetical protein